MNVARKDRERVARRGAGIQAVVLTAAGTFLVFSGRAPAFGAVLLALAVAAGCVAAVSPRAAIALDGFGRAAGRAIGGALTWVALGAFYFAIFTPGAVIRRIAGHDPLRRRFPDPGSSCWRKAATPRAPGRHDRQYS